MKQSHYFLGIALVILILAVIGCKSSQPGVIHQTGKYRIVGGNARNFQIRAENKARRDSIDNANKLDLKP